MECIRKIFFWIKCHIFNSHSYEKNNDGLTEDLTDIVNYYKCTYCEEFDIVSKFNSQIHNISEWGFNRVLKQKQAFNMCMETREVLIEKYIEYDYLGKDASKYEKHKEKYNKRHIQLLLNELDRL